MPVKSEIDKGVLEIRVSPADLGAIQEISDILIAEEGKFRFCKLLLDEAIIVEKQSESCLSLLKFFFKSFEFKEMEFLVFSRKEIGEGERREERVSCLVRFLFVPQVGEVSIRLFCGEKPYQETPITILATYLDTLDPKSGKKINLECKFLLNGLSALESVAKFIQKSRQTTLFFSEFSLLLDQKGVTSNEIPFIFKIVESVNCSTLKIDLKSNQMSLREKEIYGLLFGIYRRLENGNSPRHVVIDTSFNGLKSPSQLFKSLKKSDPAFDRQLNLKVEGSLFNIQKYLPHLIKLLHKKVEKRFMLKLILNDVLSLENFKKILDVLKKSPKNIWLWLQFTESNLVIKAFMNLFGDLIKIMEERPMLMVEIIDPSFASVNRFKSQSPINDETMVLHRLWVIPRRNEKIIEAVLKNPGNKDEIILFYKSIFRNLKPVHSEPSPRPLCSVPSLRLLAAQALWNDVEKNIRIDQIKEKLGKLPPEMVEYVIRVGLTR